MVPNETGWSLQNRLRRHLRGCDESIREQYEEGQPLRAAAAEVEEEEEVEEEGVQLDTVQATAARRQHQTSLNDTPQVGPSASTYYY